MGIVLILLFVMTIMVMTLVEMGSQEGALAARALRKSEALFLAESGIELTHAWLEAQSSPPSGTEEFHPFGEDAITVGDGECTMSIIPDPFNASLDPEIYTLVSSGTRNGHTRQVEVDVSPDIFSNYLYFTDKEKMPGNGGPLWFGTPDVIDGPLFTNDQISIMGDPTFMGTVSSAYGGSDDNNSSHDPEFLYCNGSPHNHIESDAPNNAPYDNPTFAEGYVLGAHEVDYPTHSLAFDLRDVADDGGISISGNYEIELGRVDEVSGEPMYGYVSYRKNNKPWTDVEISSFNGIFYVNGSFSVSGVLDGQLTLVTNGSIDIIGDVTYLDSDQNGPLEGCDDLLGIVAGTDINVAWNDANSDDCVIHGALMALDNSFRADNWNTGNPRGTLTVWGCIIQGFRGSVGTSEVGDGGGCVILTGYAKDYHHDTRLEYMTPPGFYQFMQTGLYIRLAWREVPVS